AAGGHGWGWGGGGGGVPGRRRLEPPPPPMTDGPHENPDGSGPAGRRRAPGHRRAAAPGTLPLLPVAADSAADAGAAGCPGLRGGDRARALAAPGRLRRRAARAEGQAAVPWASPR